MSAEKYELTLEDVEVLALIKLLNDFTNPYFPNDTIGEKITKFACESADIDRKVFDEGLDNLCKIGILKYDKEYSFTDKGKELFGEIKKKTWIEKAGEKTADFFEAAKQFVYDNKNELLLLLIEFGLVVVANHI